MEACLQLMKGEKNRTDLIVRRADINTDFALTMVL